MAHGITPLAPQEPKGPFKATAYTRQWPQGPANERELSRDQNQDHTRSQKHEPIWDYCRENLHRQGPGPQKPTKMNQQKVCADAAGQGIMSDQAV